MGITDRPLINAVDYSEGTLIHAGKASGAAGTVAAYASVTTVNITAVRATVYAEPAAAAQLEVVSSSASDAAAGTGTRTLRIVYYDGNGNGPFTTDVTLNGTNAVATAATDIRFVECMYTLTVGNNGTNVGTITLRGLGGGATVGQIAASDGRTFWGHHYVGAGRVGQITEIIAAMTLARGALFLRAQDILTPNAFDRQFTASFRLAAAGTTNSFPLEGAYSWRFSSLYVSGPTRVTAYVNPDAATANNVAHVSFGYLDVG